MGVDILGDGMAGRFRGEGVERFLGRRLGLSSEFVGSTTVRGEVGMGNVTIGVGCILSNGRRMRIGLSGRRSRGVRPRGVPLSMICRSRSVLILGGTPFVIIRPAGDRRAKALTGNVLCCFGRAGRRYVIHLIDELSVGASNLVVVKGGRCTRVVLSDRVGASGFRGECLTVIRKGLGRGRKAVGTPVCERSLSSVGEVMSPENRRDVARCGMVGDFGGTSLIRYLLRANEARRVEIRLDDLKRPVFKSDLCKARSGSCVGERTLRTCNLSFCDPGAGRGLDLETGLPCSVRRLVRELGWELVGGDLGF